MDPNQNLYSLGNIINNEYPKKKEFRFDITITELTDPDPNSNTLKFADICIHHTPNSQEPDIKKIYFRIFGSVPFLVLKSHTSKNSIFRIRIRLIPIFQEPHIKEFSIKALHSIC